MAGLLDPSDAYELVSALKQAHPDILVHMHCHYTSGMASMAYLKAVEAGRRHPRLRHLVDVDGHVASADGVHGGRAGRAPTGPPAWTSGLLEEISEYFRDVRKKYAAYESAFTAVDPAVLLWQIPGGMISNLSSQLKEQGALDRMDEVLAEVPRVRQELGYPPLVTPTSQIVGTQATLNVLMGRYKMVTKETRAYVQGYYGRPPAPIDPEVQKLIIGDETPITARPADSLEPELPKRRAELDELGHQVQRRGPHVLRPVPAGGAGVLRAARPQRTASRRGCRRWWRRSPTCLGSRRKACRAAAGRWPSRRTPQPAVRRDDWCGRRRRRPGPPGPPPGAGTHRRPRRGLEVLT